MHLVQLKDSKGILFRLAVTALWLCRSEAVYVCVYIYTKLRRYWATIKPRGFPMIIVYNNNLVQSNGHVGSQASLAKIYERVISTTHWFIVARLRVGGGGGIDSLYICEWAISTALGMKSQEPLIRIVRDFALSHSAAWLRNKKVLVTAQGIMHFLCHIFRTALKSGEQFIVPLYHRFIIIYYRKRFKEYM